MSERDGGQAFPAFVSELVYHDEADRVGADQYVPRGGMTLRDYFAGQVLMGWLAMHADHEAGVPNAIDTATAAYRYADAMLKAREV